MTDRLKFAYLRDPANPNRVVTLAWRQRPDGDKLDVKYAFAVNRVASPHNHPERTKSGLQKHHDRHCRKIGRAVAAGRYRVDIARTCGHGVFNAGKPVIESIIDDYLSIFDELTEKIVDSLEIERNSEFMRRTRGVLKLRRTVKEVFERINAWNERQVR